MVYNILKDWNSVKRWVLWLILIVYYSVYSILRFVGYDLSKLLVRKMRVIIVNYVYVI